MPLLHDRARKIRVTESLDLQKGAVLTQEGADGSVTTLGASLDEINRVADVSARVVTITATGALTEAANDGRVNLLGEVGGDALVTLTLPAASGSGARFFLQVSVVNTSSYVIQVANASDILAGQVMGSADGGNAVNGWETAADSDTITLNGSTTGGAAIGDWIELIDIATNVWSVRGQITQTGTEATPFSAAV